MLSYEEGHSGSRRLLGLGIAIAVHLVLFWALMSGLAKEVVKVVQEPLEVALLEEAPPEPEPAPPPPPKVEKPPPPAVVPKPEVVRKPPPTPPQKTIQVEQAPPDPTPPPPPQVAQPSMPTPRSSSSVTRPPYPPSSVRKGEEGLVVLKIYVDDTGDVTEAEIERSSGFKSLDMAARVHALRRWKFNPAELDGKKVGRWMTVPVRFRLEDAR